MTGMRAFLTAVATGTAVLLLAACGAGPNPPGIPSDTPETTYDTGISPDMQNPRPSPTWEAGDADPVSVMTSGERKAFDDAVGSAKDGNRLLPVALLATQGDAGSPAKAAYLAREETGNGARWVVATIDVGSGKVTGTTEIVASQLLVTDQWQGTGKQDDGGWRQPTLSSSGNWGNAVPESHVAALEDHAKSRSEEIAAVVGNLGTLTNAGTTHTLYLVAFSSDEGIPAWMFMTVASDNEGHAIVAGSEGGYMDLMGYIGE